ncbi:MAG TPA: Fe2+-dependent dioxygenase [Steroidobacteraceae bacterium]|nr:Fe2+-dependent dioxygenase [Steroidobacteraceae bacterium]
MFLQIDDFLTAPEVSAIAELARQASFISGRHSNPHNVTKNNVIVDPTDARGQKAAQIALAAFQRSEPARDFAFPRRIALPQILRYGEGMSYGAHVDAAFLTVGAQPLRSDVSCTIFINDPAEYSGGELTVYLGSQKVGIRGKPGQAVLYPSTTLHQVMPVTSGERTVMISFIESHIPEQGQRELLYTLNEVRAREGLKMEWGNRMRLEYVAANLQRMWAR